MTKRFGVLLLCGCLALAGCGGDSKDNGETAGGNNTTEAGGNAGALLNGGTSGSESGGQYWNPQGSVTLGQYKGIEVEKINATVSDEEIEEEVKMFLQDHAEYVDVEGRDTVEDGDWVEITYNLVVDGEEIDSDEGYSLEIGSEYYEFEQDLIGVKLGETKVIEKNIEDAFYTDYVGKKGTYTITVNAIQTMNVPELTDALVAENTEYATIEEYKQSVRDGLIESAQEEAKNDQIYNGFKTIIANCTFSGISEADIQSYVDENIDYYNYMASFYGMDLQSFVTMYGVTYDEFIQMTREDGDYVVKQYLILDAVVKAEKFTLTDDEYTEALNQYASENGYDSPAEVEEQFGKEEISQNALRDKAYALIIDSFVEK